MDYNSIQYLNKILGHSDVETTLRYIGDCEYTEELESLRKSFNHDNIETTLRYIGVPGYDNVEPIYSQCR